MAMRLMNQQLRNILLFCLAVIFPVVQLSEAADKASGTILVKDALTTPGQPATIEAQLNNRGLVITAPMGGEPLDLIVGGEVVGTGMTGGDGRAFLRYSTKAQGVIPIHVRVGKSSRVTTEEGYANVAVWEQRNPIVAIEVTALMESAPSTGPFFGLSLTGGPQPQPMPDAADELAKLTKFYYRVIYVVPLPSSDADRFRANVWAREWLSANHFPPGYVLILPQGEETMGAKLDELHAEGWKTVKVGIGRSKPFVEAFLKRRLEAVVLRGSATGDAPSRAKVAKDWKEVRKKI